MPMDITLLYRAALFCVGLDLISCAFMRFHYKDIAGKKQQKFDITDEQAGILHLGNVLGNEHTNPKSNPPTRVIFPASAQVISESPSNFSSTFILEPELIGILSPEMFSQPDPVSYFLEKTIGFPHKKLQSIRKNLGRFRIIYHEKIPSDCLCFSILLSNLLDCQYEVERVKQALVKMRTTFDPARSPLPAGFFTPELSEFFSPDVLSDDRAPFRFIIKLTNLPLGKSRNLWWVLENIPRNNIPEAYKDYVDQLLQFFRKQIMLMQLETSVSRARKVIARNSSNPDGLRLNGIRSEILSTNLPIFATHSSADGLDARPVDTVAR